MEADEPNGTVPMPLRGDGVFRVLLLAGVGEARQISFALSQDARIVATAAVPELRRRPMTLGIPTRIGGWKSSDVYRAWLRDNRIAGIIDATHPFASDISHQSAEVAAELGIEYLQFLRPTWRPAPGDRWEFLNSAQDAPDHIPHGAKVFVATGTHDHDTFSSLVGRHLYCRALYTSPGPFPMPNGEYVVSRPPFTAEGEAELFDHLGIEWLVCRNSGGPGSRAKVDGARRLGLPVAMIRRPPQPEANRATTISEVLAWVRRRS
ncbi:MAG: precorrin-6A/cobalt-precorrin-6A reductase [Pseudomonadota bacterium]